MDQNKIHKSYLLKEPLLSAPILMLKHII